MSKQPVMSLLLNWRLHLSVLLIAVLCEWIGIIRVPIGIGTLVLLPLLYAFVLALLLNPHVIASAARLIGREQCQVATYAVLLSVMPFIAKFGTTIGPKVEEIIAAGPALILQEIGNVATALLALPVAVLLFNMGREAVGATHSIAREPNIALIADKYGLKSPEGIGVMGACSAALAELAPADKESIAAFAASSNLLTYATGLFVSLFIALPFTNWFYRVLRKLRPQAAEANHGFDGVAMQAPEQPAPLSLTNSAILLALICAVLLVSNWVGQKVSPLEGLPGMLMLYGCCIGGMLIRRLLPVGGIPAIAWVSILGIVISLPQFPGSAYVLESAGKLGVLQLITPVLAYAGFAISQMEVDLFKRAGFKIAVVALLTFTGTFIGSVLIADMLL